MNRKLHFIIEEEPAELRTQQITDLCDYLTVKVLEPMFERVGHRWHRRFMHFVTADPASDPTAPTGVILLEVPALLAGQVGELEAAVRRALSALGIRTGPLTRTCEPLPPHRSTIVVPVLENPTVLIAPPEVNIAYQRGVIVLRDLLGYQPAQGRYAFAAADVLQRVSSVSEEKIAACSAGPVAGPSGIRCTPSSITMKSLKRCLDEIRQFALWATQHNYRSLAAA